MSDEKKLEKSTSIFPVNLTLLLSFQERKILISAILCKFRGCYIIFSDYKNIIFVEFDKKIKNCFFSLKLMVDIILKVKSKAPDLILFNSYKKCQSPNLHLFCKNMVYKACKFRSAKWVWIWLHFKHSTGENGPVLLHAFTYIV